MNLLDPAELAQVQALAQSGMSGTATILVRSVVVTDDGQESVWATSGDDVVCWVREMISQGADLGAIAGAVGIGILVSIRVPVGTAVASGDRIAVGSTIYDVQHSNQEDTYPVWVNCICRTIE